MLQTISTLQKIVTLQMNKEQKTKLIPRACRLFDVAMGELESIHHTSEEKYHILRYLTNMLEAEEEKLWKEINE